MNLIDAVAQKYQIFALPSLYEIEIKAYWKWYMCIAKYKFRWIESGIIFFLGYFVIKFATNF